MRREPTGPVVGVVTNIADPDKKARVKLKFPWLSDDYESDWARVVCPGAGSGRGLVALPEVDDEVLVVFAHDDFRQPYVVGGLFNGKDKPPEGETLVGSEGKVEFRRLVSRAGHSVALDDGTGGGGIAIRTGGQQEANIEVEAAGHKIRLTGDGDVEIEGKQTGKITIKTGSAPTIESGTSLTIEAKSSLTLKAPQITLDATTQVQLKSGGQLELQGAHTTLKGSAMAQVDGGPLLTIQGGLVKIN